MKNIKVFFLVIAIFPLLYFIFCLIGALYMNMPYKASSKILIDFDDNDFNKLDMIDDVAFPIYLFILPLLWVALSLYLYFEKEVRILIKNAVIFLLSFTISLFAINNVESIVRWVLETVA